MADRDQALDALRHAVESFAGERAPDLVDEARAAAETRVRTALTDVFTEALLDGAREELDVGAGERPLRRQPGPPTPPRERPAEPPTPRRERPAELGCYVYGVAAAGVAQLPEQLTGVDPAHAPTLLEHRGLVAIASRVSLGEFGEEPLHENLNDVDWLEAKARAHEQVLDAALSRMPVVPMRLCTIYRSEAQVREMLEREHAVFVDALHRLEGKTEWGVKLIAEPGALLRAADASAGEEGGSEAELSAGAAYMREKKREAHRRSAVDRIAEKWAEEVHDKLAARAVEALLNPLQNPEVSGHIGDMLLNGVYLVDDRAIDTFSATIDALKERFDKLGATVELTGPWPPYNFVKGSIEAAR